VATTERIVDAPDHWPVAEELERRASGDVLVILPEEVGEVDGKLTAFFRPEAQALRAKAMQAGLTPLMLAPEGAEVAGYSEFAADWVLPVIVAASLAIPAQIVADVLVDRIAEAGHGPGAPLIVRYREAVTDQKRVCVREIEGPAQEVERLLRERGVTLRLPC
jgi:hypothetical protein